MPERRPALLLHLDERYKLLKPGQKIVDLARSRGLLLLKSGTYKNVIRLLPPLTTPPDELARGLDVLAGACAEVFA